MALTSEHRRRVPATVMATISVLALLSLATWASVKALEPVPGPLPLGGSNSIDVRYGSTPTIDGAISPGEYGSPSQIQFPGRGGTVLVYVKHDGSKLYVAFDLPDTNPPSGLGPAAQIFLDTNHDRATTPQTDDYRLTISKNGTLWERQGAGGGWGLDGLPPNGWSGAFSVNAAGWQAEFSIGFAKLGITPGTPKTIGFTVANVWTPADHYWPTGVFWKNPSTWGEAYSSQQWPAWHFKEGGLTDYALSGLPDFDQKQNEWRSPDDKWTYCGPVAAANSLWWFDSKFEPEAVLPPTVNDGYPLVEAYEAWDDHNVSNALPLVDELAKYFDTDPITGTSVYSMYSGIQSYLSHHGLYDDYVVTLAVSPTIDWVTNEVTRSEDVILLLGFWQEVSLKPPEWERIGGHYVTVAGVAPENSLIAFSDPFVDMAEQGAPGRVLSGTLTLPHSPGHNASVHNDAGNVSHDFYTMTLDSPSPGGLWWLPDYPAEDLAKNFAGVNAHPDYPTSELDPSFKLHTEVEFAIAVSRIFEAYLPLTVKRY